MKTLVVTLLTAFAFAAPHAIDPTDTPPATSSGPESAVFEIAEGTHNLPELVARAANFLHRNILWSPHEQSANTEMLQVQITSPMALDPTECEDVVASLLYRVGFALVPLNPTQGLYEVISMQGPRRAEIQGCAEFRTPAEILARPESLETVLTTVHFEHIDTSAAVTTLRPFFTTAGAVAPLQFGSVGSNRSMLIQGFGRQVASALRLLALVDVPQRKESESDAADSAAKVAVLAERVERLEQFLEQREKAAAQK